MKNYSLDKNHLDQIEDGIAPPMSNAITIPVQLDGKESGVIIYVCGTFFGSSPPRQLVSDVAKRLTIYSG